MYAIIRNPGQYNETIEAWHHTYVEAKQYLDDTADIMSDYDIMMSVDGALIPSSIAHTSTNKE